ncbi:MAG: alcohol dehydrogenase catalytic domain-containing protein [Treponema sp.]|nr:alcohol dehydrogenase catalytic domain-containing protein [Treponema sp.]
MTAIRKMKPAPGADILDVPVPRPGPRDLLVKVKATALCKSDVDIYEWTPLIQAGNFKPPYTMGHEFAGEVVETGELVTGFAKGDRVAGETHIPCGTCRECRTGNAHICSNHMGVLGRTCDGSFAEYIRLPEVSAIPLAKGIRFAAGSVYEPMGTAIHALQKAQVSGKNVAILGPGTIGLMACEAAKVLGATAVIAVGSNHARLEYSLKLGADAAINWKEKDFAAEIKKNYSHLDAVIDCTGNTALIDKAIDALSTAGTLVLVGMINAELSIPRYMYRVVYRELRITGIYGRHLYTTWDILDNLLSSGRLDLDHYVGEQLPLRQFDLGLKHFSQLAGRAVLLPEEK